MYLRCVTNKNLRYNSFTPELKEARFKARAFAHKFNTWFPASSEAASTGFETLSKERLKMLQGIIGHLGDDEICKPPIDPQFAGENMLCCSIS